MTDQQVITFGCRLNAFESEVMQGHARRAGLNNVVIVNTCAVTAEAVRQAGQAIRRARRERPDAAIIVTGCAAQTDPNRFAAMPAVDGVLGNGEKMQASQWLGLRSALAEGTAGRTLQPTVSGTPGEPLSQLVRVGDIAGLTAAITNPAEAVGGRARAYVEVQNGCDHRCTFCIIPYGRGPSRSVPSEHIVAQARRLVDGGIAEIVLTGVDITSYGLDTGSQMRLGQLVRHILAKVPELKRLRLSSIDSIEADATLLEAFADEVRLMPHVHLSLQAGDDMILKRMKRRHNRSCSITFCNDVRRLRPDVVFGADLIAGFPTETEEMHENTMRLIDECGLTFLHVFPFSIRPGTPAARMPQLSGATIKQRAANLRQKGAQQLAAFMQRQHGRVVEIVVEKDGLGRTPEFAELVFDPSQGPTQPVGSVIKARVVSSNAGQLLGQVIA